MKPSRGRSIALWTAVGSMAIFAAAGFAFRSRLLEEYSSSVLRTP